MHYLLVSVYFDDMLLLLSILHLVTELYFLYFLCSMCNQCAVKAETENMKCSHILQVVQISNSSWRKRIAGQFSQIFLQKILAMKMAVLND